LWAPLLGLAIFLSFALAAPSLAEDIAVIRDPLGYPVELEDSFFYYNKFLRGKKYKDIKKIDRYDRNYNTPLIYAILYEDIAAVRKILDQGANPNIISGNAMSPIGAAIFRRDIDVIKLLLKRGSRPTKGDMFDLKLKKNPELTDLIEPYYRPPKENPPDPRIVGKVEKHISVDSEDAAYELKDIVDWETKNNKYHPSVTAAVMFNRPFKVLQQLYDEGSSFSQEHPKLGTPLAQAIHQGRDLEYIEFLLIRLANPNHVSKPYKRWPLLQAVTANNIDLARLLFEHGAKMWFPEAQGLEPPYSYVLKNGSLNMNKLFLEKGADPTIKIKDAKGVESWPFLLAVGFGDVSPKLLDLLISSGADPKVKDDKGCNALALMKWDKANIPAIIRLLEIGVSPKDSCGSIERTQSLYHLAVREESKELVEALAKTKLSPNVWDENDSTPLYLAVIFDKPFLVKALIDAGANVNKSVAAPGVIYADYRGVHKASEDLLAEAIIHTNSPEIIETLLDAGVKINTVTNSPDRLTALHVAVEENKPELAELILKRKSVNKNAKNINGQTPLHIAVRAQDTKFVKLLVNAGAKLDVKDNEGLTPVDHARGERKEKELLAAMGL
jgi:ankyrin repeat protein